MDDDGFESFLMMILMTEKLVFTFIIVFFSGDFFFAALMVWRFEKKNSFSTTKIVVALVSFAFIFL